MTCSPLALPVPVTPNQQQGVVCGVGGGHGSAAVTLLRLLTLPPTPPQLQWLEEVKAA